MKKREPRTQVLLRAQMRTDGQRSDVCICNLSSGGMLLQSASPPPRSAYVDVVCGHHAMVGRVIWSSEHRFGVRTRSRIDVEAVVKAAASSARAGKPEARAGFAAISEAGAAPMSADRGRQLSAAIQYAILGACGIGAALFCGMLVYDLLGALTGKLTPLG